MIGQNFPLRDLTPQEVNIYDQLMFPAGIDPEAGLNKFIVTYGRPSLEQTPSLSTYLYTLMLHNAARAGFDNVTSRAFTKAFTIGAPLVAAVYSHANGSTGELPFIRSTSLPTANVDDEVERYLDMAHDRVVTELPHFTSLMRRVVPVLGLAGFEEQMQTSAGIVYVSVEDIIRQQQAADELQAFRTMTQGLLGPASAFGAGTGFPEARPSQW